MRKIYFASKERGLEIDNLPDAHGFTTGRFEFDYYGCWWEVKDDNGGFFWMIGEYPDWYYRTIGGG